MGLYQWGKYIFSSKVNLLTSVDVYFSIKSKKMEDYSW